jgi:ribosomal protein S18 acetylase RimI-like enzyme
MHATVRRAGFADAAVIAEFNRLLALESEKVVLDPVKLAAGVAAVLADPAKGLYFVAEQDGQIVGQLGITSEYSDWRNGWQWWIQSVYVQPEYRRRGVFRALYAHVERLATEDAEVVGLRLYVEHENHSARQTYRSLGMKQTGYVVMEKGVPSS